MLKIKDGTDLKELEKFGFQFRPETENSTDEYEKITKDGSTVVFTWNREIFCQDLDVIWDLIQANLVEKVKVNDKN